eukprot:CAMPEP_0202904644 /NCGR_PEP_ID=MMETSP1392-20130828/30463_1 /ASSEMBLY_ACC=CAM_ASM_000868 /TAXON_ID=225041 /ORGANISM="Chlamydomonas chlamydogama, Strain SAG 11-48b" /LENGTH=321 /DNA_ID=CAMNT_0049592387 /DNA_START=167 /DNA_END=1135 /DNA_ORIENTATION=+
MPAPASALGVRAGDILQLDAESSTFYMEVTQAPISEAGSIQTAWQGNLLRLDHNAEQISYKISYVGPVLRAGDPLLKSFPGWLEALTRQGAALQQRQQQDLAKLPEVVPAASVHVVGSLSQLEGMVGQDASRWCTGSGPSDSPPSGVQYQMQSAGELLALLTGQRGVAMVQLHVGWDSGAPQPVHNPLVIPLLRQAVTNPDLCVAMSSAQGGLGLTAMLSAKKEPFKSWAAHLASFGAQAALVADSPYYKLLIGRVLGYKEEHIIAHIQSSNGPGQPSKEVVAAVERQLAALSHKKPSLPWNTSSRGKRKAGGAKGQQGLR